MNVVEYKSANNHIVYIIVDRTESYQNSWTTELTKNISDFVVSNIVAKEYSVLVGLDEDQLLNYAAVKNYNTAVVLSTGTDFINGDSFFKAVENLSKEDFFLAGHILDRGDAYYELHHQCYVINLEKYRTLGFPVIGQQELGSKHTQYAPMRSLDNIHDDYTPVAVTCGFTKKDYNHKCHGWNILSIAFDIGGSVKVFDDAFRNNKKYYYPENQSDFLNHISWAYSREKICANQFVHTSNTESVYINDNDFDCIITPASGSWFTTYIKKDTPVKIIYYDYNQNSLDFWKEHAPKLPNVSYEFLQIDLLGKCDYDNLLQTNMGKTCLNLSNIFCYEGTSVFSNLSYRLHKENEILKKIPSDFYVLFNSRSFKGFYDAPHYGQNLKPVEIKSLLKPTWHVNRDWT